MQIKKEERIKYILECKMMICIDPVVSHFYNNVKQMQPLIIESKSINEPTFICKALNSNHRHPSHLAQSE